MYLHNNPSCFPAVLSSQPVNASSSHPSLLSMSVGGKRETSYYRILNANAARITVSKKHIYLDLYCQKTMDTFLL